MTEIIIPAGKLNSSRNFLTKQALDSALKTRNPLIVVTVLEELNRRSGLSQALSGRGTGCFICIVSPFFLLVFIFASLFFSLFLVLFPPSFRVPFFLSFFLVFFLPFSSILYPFLSSLLFLLSFFYISVLFVDRFIHPFYPSPSSFYPLPSPSPSLLTDESTLEPLLSFAARYVSHPRYARLIVAVAHKVLDLYACVLGHSDSIDELFLKLHRQVRVYGYGCTDTSVQWCFMLFYGIFLFYQIWACCIFSICSFYLL